MSFLTTLVLGIKEFYKESQGYNSKGWLESDTVRELKDISSKEVPKMQKKLNQQDWRETGDYSC